MPLHKRISKRDLEEWISYIKLVCNKILLNPDIIFVSHLIVSLFEYCQVFCYFRIHKVEDEAVNFKVTVSDIKATLEDEDFYSVANNFMQIRHLLSHGFISDKTKKAVNSLLEDPDFILLLKGLNLDSNTVNCIEEAVFRFCECNEIGKSLICTDKGLSSPDKVVGLKSNSPVRSTSALDTILREAEEAKRKLNLSTNEDVK